MKQLNIIISNATLQNGNRGCDALTFSIIFLIEKIFSETGIKSILLLTDAQIKSWDFHDVIRIKNKEYGVKVISQSVPYSKKSLVICFLRNIFLFLIKKRNSINNFKKADYLINIGQGDSFADIYGTDRFDMINRAYEKARYYHIPYCILPQTIGPFNNSDVEEKARISIKGARLVMARDKQSCEFTKQLVPSCDVKEYIDVAFFLPYSIIKQPANKLHVGLNVSALLWNGGYTRDNQFGLKCDYKELIKSIIDYFLSIPNVVIHLVPHVVEPDPGIENDYEVSYNIWRELGDDRVVLAPFALTPVDIKSYIAGLDFFMGARMHATIAAFSSGVPVVPMAYSRKFNGLYEDTLSYHHIVDMKANSNESSLSLIKEAFTNRKDLKKVVDYQNATTVKQRGEMIEADLKKFFGI